MTSTNSLLRQRTEYTHKGNLKIGRHAWLRLTPAYSVRIVEEMIGTHDRNINVLDPFCGTGTTALCAANHGHSATTTDINPFLVWLAKVKTDHYSAAALDQAKQVSAEIVSNCRKGLTDPSPEPPIHNIERWWPGSTRDFLCRLRGAICGLAPRKSRVRNLLDIAFCRTLISLSNAAFNHQSMSFKDSQPLELPLESDSIRVFAEDIALILRGAAENPIGQSTVVQADARRLDSALSAKFDVVITSPPYANRMSYIRELRPYMYWLDFLHDASDAGELDWECIGGTWGVATSRLLEWESKGSGEVFAQLTTILDKIRHVENRNGHLLANYVAKYFEDIYLHLASLTKVLSCGAQIHYIVGNSTFYGTLVPVEQLYASVLRELGFLDISVTPIRKRNSKKELIEFDVAARWR